MKTSSFLEDLYIVSKEKKEDIERFAFWQKRTLNTIESTITALFPTSQDINVLFESVAESEDLESIFYLQLDHSGQVSCLYSSAGKCPLHELSFYENLLRYLEEEKSIVLLRNDQSSQPEIYNLVFVPSKGGKKNGVLITGSSFSQELNLVAPHQIRGIPYKILLVSDHSNQITSDFTNIDAIQILENPSFPVPPDSLKNSLVGYSFPIPNSNFKLVAYIDMQEVRKEQHQVYFKEVVIFIALFLCVAGIATLVLSYLMTKPLSQLFKVMEEVSEGSLEKRFKPTFLGFEINVLGKRFNSMVDDLIHTMKNAEKERRSKEILETDLRIAHEIQSSMLPKTMPNFPGLEISCYYKPAKQIAGDFYDLFPMPNTNSLLMTIADVSGKGVPAGLYSVGFRSALRSFASSGASLTDMLQYANKLFCEDVANTGNFVTCWAATYEPNTHQLCYTSCGHHPAILRKKDGSLIDLMTEGAAVGLHPELQVITNTLSLESGDLLFAYTDGLIEAHDEKKNQFGRERLYGYLKECPHQSADTLMKDLIHQVDLFTKKAPLFDDLTLLVIRVL